MRRYLAGGHLHGPVRGAQARKVGHLESVGALKVAGAVGCVATDHQELFGGGQGDQQLGQLRCIQRTRRFGYVTGASMANPYDHNVLHPLRASCVG